MNNYILDKKENLASIVIPIGLEKKVVINSQFEVIPVGSTEPYISTGNNGVTIGSSINNNVAVNTHRPNTVRFKQLTGNYTYYNMTVNDYAVEVVSPTYTTITLPSSVNNGGRLYAISTTSMNPNLFVLPQPGESIDGGPSIQLKQKYTHIHIMSNNIADWYIL